MAGPFHPLVQRWKSLASPITWSAPSPIDGKLEFLAPLDIDGITIAELALRGIAFETRPDADVTLQLETGLSGTRTRIPLIRLDWRPFSPFHKNDRKGPPDLQGLIIRGSHFHPFEWNWLEDAQRMRSGNLPVAEEITDPLQTFIEMLDFAQTLFRIGDITSITEPEWAPKLI